MSDGRVRKYVWCNEIHDGQDWDAIEKYLFEQGVILDTRWHERSSWGRDAIVLRGDAYPHQWEKINLPSLRVGHTLAEAHEAPLEESERRIEEREMTTKRAQASIDADLGREDVFLTPRERLSVTMGGYTQQIATFRRTQPTGLERAHLEDGLRRTERYLLHNLLGLLPRSDIETLVTAIAKGGYDDAANE